MHSNPIYSIHQNLPDLSSQRTAPLLTVAAQNGPTVKSHTHLPGSNDKSLRGFSDEIERVASDQGQNLLIRRRVEDGKGSGDRRNRSVIITIIGFNYSELPRDNT